MDLFNLINHQPAIDKIYIYAKNSYEAKYQFSINKPKSTGSKPFDDFKTFIQYSNSMDDIYTNIKEYNPNKERKVLIVFVDTIVDMLINKKLHPVVTELSIRVRKLNILILF